MSKPIVSFFANVNREIRRFDVHALTPEIVIYSAFDARSRKPIAQWTAMSTPAFCDRTGMELSSNV